MSSTIISEVCRVGVQTEAGMLDLVLPANIAVAAIIPSIVDIAVAGASASSLRVPTDWQLSRIGGHPLSPRRSLRDNDVRDGDLLLLSQVRPAVAPPPTDDVIAAIPMSLDSTLQWTPAAARVAGSIVALCCSGLLAYALIRSDARASAVIAAALSAVAFIAAVTYGRVYRDSIAAVALACASTTCAAVAGYLVVSGDTEAPKLMLAAAVGATVSVLAARCTASGTVLFTATASAGFLSAVDAYTYLLVPMRVSAAGAALGAAAVAMVALSARLAIWASRLPVPPLPASSRSVLDGAARGDLTSGARRAHAIATGLVCGSCAAAAMGATLTTLGGKPNNAALAAVIGLGLVLRAATHVDLVQTAALITSGTLCFAAVLVRAVDAQPHNGHWIGLGAAGIAAVAIGLSGSSRSASPLLRRCVELIEYVSLAAVIPLACWVCGVFGAVRGLS